MRRFCYYGAIGGFGFCLGEGASLMWPDWSPWTWWAVGCAFLLLLPLPTLWDRREAIKAGLALPALPGWLVPVGGFVALLCLLFVLVDFGVYSPVAYPPDGMSPTEVNRNLGRCKKESIVAVASMKGGNIFDRTHHQNMYWAACLLEIGFRIED